QREDGTFTLACIGRFSPVKNIAASLAVLERLADLPVRLRLVGDGPGRSQLEARAQAAGLGARVEVLGRRDSRTAVLADTDILLQPSRYESFGIVAVEAMRRGAVPVVGNAACSTTALQDLLRDGENGLTVDFDRPDAAASAIRHLLGDGDLRQ